MIKISGIRRIFKFMKIFDSKIKIRTSITFLFDQIKNTKSGPRADFMIVMIHTHYQPKTFKSVVTVKSLSKFFVTANLNLCLSISWQQFTEGKSLILFPYYLHFCEFKDEIFRMYFLKVSNMKQNNLVFVNSS